MDPRGRCARCPHARGPHGQDREIGDSDGSGLTLDGVNDETIELLQPYMQMEDFNPTKAVEEMEASGLDTSIAEGLCTWSLFVRDYRAAVRQFADEKKLGEASLHRGYMQRLQRLAEEALATGRAREQNAHKALAEAEEELKAARQEQLELLGEDEEALRRAAEARKQRNLQKARSVTRTAEGLAQLRKEADETRRRAEERGRLLDLWNTYDADGSGDLDRQEVRTVLTKMGRLVTETKLDRAFEEMDANGDNLVTFDEFIDWWDEQESGGISAADELGWPFHADLDDRGYGFEIYEKAVQLKNKGEWQASLEVFEEYRQALTSELAKTQSTQGDERPGSAHDSGRSGSASQPQEQRFVLKDPNSPALPQKFGWDPLLSLPVGKDGVFGNHSHLRCGTAPAAIRRRKDCEPPDDVLLKTLSAQADPAFWEELALQRECREKYGLRGTVGFLSSELASR